MTCDIIKKMEENNARLSFGFVGLIGSLKKKKVAWLYIDKKFLPFLSPDDDS